MKQVKYTVILFYTFTNIKNPEQFREKQRKIAQAFGLTGRMLIAKEGINATFEGKTRDIKGYIKELRKQTMFKNVVFKESESHGKAFTKLMVKTRPEVVTLEIGDLNVKKETAKTVTATQLEKMYDKKEDFVILDLRNDFEINAGYFENTVNPKLKNFKDLPEKLAELAPLKDKKVVAVCTGGIRCEKGTVLLKQYGFKNLYQLKDGIHTYMKKYPGKRFKGSLFVFDNRIVTPVVDTPNREIVARCFYCATACEEFYNDDSVRPSRKVVCCQNCITTRKYTLRPAIPV